MDGNLKSRPKPMQMLGVDRKSDKGASSEIRNIRIDVSLEGQIKCEN